MSTLFILSIILRVSDIYWSNPYMIKDKGSEVGMGDFYTQE